GVAARLKGMSAVRVSLLAVLVSFAAFAATPQAPDQGARVRQAIAMVEQGRCAEALPVLERAMPRLTGKELRYHAAMAEARCAMALEHEVTAVEALLQLKREFPDDPETLFIAVHYFSE